MNRKLKLQDILARKRKTKASDFDFDDVKCDPENRLTKPFFDLTKLKKYEPSPWGIIRSDVITREPESQLYSAMNLPTSDSTKSTTEIIKSWFQTPDSIDNGFQRSISPELTESTSHKEDTSKIAGQIEFTTEEDQITYVQGRKRKIEESDTMNLVPAEELQAEEIQRKKMFRITDYNVIDPVIMKKAKAISRYQLAASVETQVIQYNWITRKPKAAQNDSTSDKPSEQKPALRAYGKFYESFEKKWKTNTE